VCRKPIHFLPNVQGIACGVDVSAGVVFTQNYRYVTCLRCMATEIYKIKNGFYNTKTKNAEQLELF
jgi:predicted nucleic-acid-binding Zn-ribbon protein